MIIRYLTLITILIFASSCKKEHMCDCFIRTGDITTQSRDLADFETIVAKDIFNVYISDDTTNSITIEGGENLIKNIFTEIENETLLIENQNTCNWTRSYKKDLYIYISATNLKNISIEGPINLYSTNTLKFDTLRIDINTGISSLDIDVDNSHTSLRIHSGTGDYKLSGKTNYSYLYSCGNSYINAQNLITNFTHIVHRSTGSSNVNVKEKFLIENIEHGTVYYTGNPDEKTIQNISKNGSLIKLD